MSFNQKHFQENELAIKDIKIKYYSSPILLENNFKHGFLTKTSSEINLTLLSKRLNLKNNNCVLNQIHSNQVVFGSETQEKDAKELNEKFTQTKNNSYGYQFISIQSTPFVEKFSGFWILKDVELIS